ncbi:hypothetical protein [Advenella faeciporci]
MTAPLPGLKTRQACPTHALNLPGSAPAAKKPGNRIHPKSTQHRW